MNMHFSCGRFELDLSTPRVMGIVNVTPDSFSDGGKFNTTDKAVAHALELVEQGADILDIGGESTRPGATPVPLDEELSRVIPVIKALIKAGVPLSIDTYKPEVMRAAIDAGVDIVNDVCALQEANALEIVAASQVGVCLMHMQGRPQTMQADPQYQDVVAEVTSFLATRLKAAEQAGIVRGRIVLDPGFGFGKRTEHNLTLLNHLSSLQSLGLPLLVGLSRKSVLGQVVGLSVDERMHASIAASVVSVMKGANIVRVHDVKPTLDALKIVSAVMKN
ncbi:MAG: dihydropteroate synthase [Burkholderiaceae bacterium]|nr:dihydropteroate synthase [Burkholderiaceae bacterium]